MVMAHTLPKALRYVNPWGVVSRISEETKIFLDISGKMCYYNYAESREVNGISIEEPSKEESLREPTERKEPEDSDPKVGKPRGGSLRGRESKQGPKVGGKGL